MGWSNLLVVFVHAASVLIALRGAAGKLCTPGFCSKVTCKPIKASECNGKVEANASDCGCCEFCVKQLDEGDVCFSFTKYGQRKWAVCKKGLMCSESTFRCVKNFTHRLFGDDDKPAAEMDTLIAFQ
ncbi:uncharacterized protein [Dermacentor albipictus]|uniref:uncharacterized protein n=1 Tax=Dermacentor albipictus TaxID=60249 RepID=UPI0031FC104A